MFEALYMAATGLINQQRRMDVTADNVANVNTNGFKASRLDFKDAIYTAGIDPGPAYTPDGNLQKGHGVMTAAITHDFSGASLIATGNMLDFAIEGDAFFEVVDPYGNVYYTGRGNFYTVNGTEGFTLTNSDGWFVLDENGEKIVLPEGTVEAELSPDGLLTFKSGDSELGNVRLGMYTFPNKTGLNAAGNGNYTVTVASGEAIPATDYRINQYMLENSNVDMATEMTRLLRTQRAFSLAARALKTADDMEGIANNMRR